MLGGARACVRIDDRLSFELADLIRFLDRGHGAIDLVMEEQSTGIIQRKLLETASELLVRILGRLTTSFKADDTGVLDTVGIGQLQAILEELNAVWESVQDPDIRYEIATSASNVEAVLETVCDFIFRTTRRKDFGMVAGGWGGGKPMY